MQTGDNGSTSRIILMDTPIYPLFRKILINLTNVREGHL